MWVYRVLPFVRNFATEQQIIKLYFTVIRPVVTYSSETWTLRLGADQSSKAAFGKSAFAKTCYNVFSFVKDMTWRTPIEQKAKMLSSMFWHDLAKTFCSLHFARPLLSVKAFVMCIRW